MSHTVFQTAQIMPIYTSTIPTSKVVSSQKQLLHPAAAFHRLAVAGKMRKSCIRASSSVVDGDAVSALERCFQASPPADCPTSSAGSPVMFAPVMKGGKYGSLGAVTLEKSKLDMSQKQTKSSPEVRF
nr:protein RETICULATA-RELATED 1, chloroplastic-like [Ipomoea batatas]